jgi:hypothetical protein
MKTYLLTSTKWAGEIELRYDDGGWLTGYDYRAELSEEQRAWFLNYMPRRLIDLQPMVKTTHTAKLTEMPEKEVTFGMFWERYDDAATSSRKRTLKKWEKMAKSEQIKAYRHIYTYFAAISRGNTRKKYAETYLNDELWNN